MTTVQDPNAPVRIPMWKIVLNLVFAGLGVLKGMGLFTKKSGPDIK